MVGISGAFGAICLALYITSILSPSTSMLGLLLGPQFHLFVLGSGIALVVVAGIRGVSLWRRVGQPAHVHDHHHDQDHAHGHDHGEQGCCGEHHHHDHAHAHHEHHHDHSAEDHDHGWAPWRYVLLL